MLRPGKILNLGGLGEWVLLGWRIGLRRRGLHIDRPFTLKEFGDMDAALQMAIKFRDEIHRDYMPNLPKLRNSPKKKCKNSINSLTYQS